MPNKFSIILPVRNGGGYVKECVNSILAQTYREFDLIVLDNCSTDGTREWIESLQHPAIRLYPSAVSLSMEDNWARAATVPKHEFMTLIGHDDLLFPDYLEEMDRLITQHPDASLYQAHFTYIDAGGKLVRHCKPMKAILQADEFLEAEILQTLDSTGTGYMMRSSDYDAAGGISGLYPRLIFADYELWMKLIRKGYMAVTPATCFSYRLHDSVSKLTNGEDYQQAFGRYMHFLHSLQGDAKIAAVIDKHIKKMLLYFCKSLSHRLLKTPGSIRKTSVADFVRECKSYAAMLIPAQTFSPLLKPSILAAVCLDNPVGLKIFRLYKRLKG